MVCDAGDAVAARPSGDNGAGGTGEAGLCAKAPGSSGSNETRMMHARHNAASPVWRGPLLRSRFHRLIRPTPLPLRRRVPQDPDHSSCSSKRSELFMFCCGVLRRNTFPVAQAHSHKRLSLHSIHILRLPAARKTRESSARISAPRWGPRRAPRKPVQKNSGRASRGRFHLYNREPRQGGPVTQSYEIYPA